MAEMNRAAKPASSSAVNPYAAPQALVDDSHDGAAELASRGSRFAASFVDTLVFGGVGILAAVLIPAFANNPTAAALIGIAAGVGIIAMVFFNLRWLYLYGQTIGKRALKIRITRTDGSDAGLARLLFLRGLPQWIVQGLSQGIPLLGILSLVDALVIFGAPHRCVHDYIADTIVVKVQ